MLLFKYELGDISPEGQINHKVDLGKKVQFKCSHTPSIDQKRTLQTQQKKKKKKIKELGDLSPGGQINHKVDLEVHIHGSNKIRRKRQSLRD